MYTNYPFGVCLAHNGNLTNVKELKESVFAEARHINTDSVREEMLCWAVVFFFVSSATGVVTAYNTAYLCPSLILLVLMHNSSSTICDSSDGFPHLYRSLIIHTHRRKTYPPNPPHYQAPRRPLRGTQLTPHVRLIKLNNPRCSVLSLGCCLVDEEWCFARLVVP